MSYLVYPGATHKRFEHSLGVMELAGRVFDSVVNNSSDDTAVRDAFPQLKNKDALSYWRRVLRVAAVTHDVGHLPFSHAAEKELLPKDWSHERLTAELIHNSELTTVIRALRPTIDVEDVVKVALGPKKSAELGLTLSPWETFLAEIIVGDAFGVDRMDYLLRDSLHAGVAYGRFDHYRLIDTLRLLLPPTPEAMPLLTEELPPRQPDPVLGLEEGGLQSAEALLIARYMMYSQVYFHHVRRIYDIHLQEFLSAWLTGGRFSTVPEDLLAVTDNEVNSAILSIVQDKGHKAFTHAERIIKRKHFRRLYSRNPGDAKLNPRALPLIYDATVKQFGPEHVRKDEYLKGASAPDFPVLLRDGQVVSSLSYSDIFAHLPSTAIGHVFISPEKAADAVAWLKYRKNQILN
jgi:HD superfamily phosphohydrolase